MAELFVEFFGEEIPARMQSRAEEHLSHALAKALQDHQLGGVLIRSWSGPRRLAVGFGDVTTEQSDQTIEKRGPRVGAPDQAVEGFLSSAGITRDQLETRETAKGAFYFAMIHQPGQLTADILPDVINTIIAQFPWAKSQRWAKTQASWVRPLHRINVLLDGKPVKGYCDLGGNEGISYGELSYGHRFLAPQDISLNSDNQISDSYDATLAKHFVMAHRGVRQAEIVRQIDSLAKASGFQIVEDEGLLQEVTGLVEWPQAVMGQIEDDFMSLPGDILVLTMRSHQKYFALTDASGKLAPAFITISNMAADQDRDEMIRIGNERVLRARLSDARFLWDQDRAISLNAHSDKLSGMAYFDGLGTVLDRVDRIVKITAQLADQIPDLPSDNLTVAARLCKADLVTGTVGEFPELQGIMGGHLAIAEGLVEGISTAISEHYKPVGSGDHIPSSSMGQALALADKLDMLTSFFAIGKKPSGSGDPFGLRRAALGIIRILDEAEVHLDLAPLLGKAKDELISFLVDRLHVYCRDKGIRYDIVRAVIETDLSNHQGRFDILALIRRLEETSHFLDSENGKALMSGWRRVNSILESERSKSKTLTVDAVDPSHFADPTEAILFDAAKALDHASEADDKTRLSAMANMTGPIHEFFEAVKVNDDDPAVRQNRLNLLAGIDQAMLDFADFRVIEG